MSDLLRELAENAASACLPFLPLEGSWTNGYSVSSRVGSEVRALPEEWAEAALAISELHRALAIEPEPAREYEYRALWVGPGGHVVPDPAIRRYGTREQATSRLSERPRALRHGIERRVKAGPWERVEG